MAIKSQSHKSKGRAKYETIFCATVEKERCFIDLCLKEAWRMMLDFIELKMFL